jgi:hypothetical protein
LLLPSLIAAASVAVGAGLGLSRSDAGRALRIAQVAALVTALGVALFQLLPESLEALGGAALAVFALPLLPLLRPASRSTRALTLELGYAALLVHQLVDGVLLGAYGGVVYSASEHAGLLAAVALHTVPVAAAIALRFEQRSDRRAAIARTVGMAAASLLGIALTGWIPTDVALRIDPWASAAIAGLLIQTVLQGWRVALQPVAEPHVGG